MSIRLPRLILLGVCVSCLVATRSMSISAEPALAPAQAQVGRYVPHPSTRDGYAALDTTNGQLWVFNHVNGWMKWGSPISEQRVEALKPPATPDPTGKLRPKPEEDFNKGRGEERRR